MNKNQYIYSELWRELLNSESDNEYEDIIHPWLEKAHTEKTWLIEFSKRQGKPIPDASIEDSWRLYALSRINDVCLFTFQPRIDPGASPNTLGYGPIITGDGPNITIEQYINVFETLGLNVKTHNVFHPFYHEIVAVEQSGNVDERITITKTLWPCLMLGNMLFSRAGVVVRGGANYIRKNIAQSSTMYWTYLRKYKKYRDLSHGWGSNSQWRTRFRRDYFVQNHYFYNVDADPDEKVDLSNKLVTFDASSLENASREESIELLKNRCFIHAQIQPDNDLWPYDDYFTEPG